MENINYAELTVLYKEGHIKHLGETQAFVELRQWVEVVPGDITRKAKTDTVIEYGITVALPEINYAHRQDVIYPIHKKTFVRNVRDKTDAELIRLAISIFDDMQTQVKENKEQWELEVTEHGKLVD